MIHTVFEVEPDFCFGVFSPCAAKTAGNVARIMWSKTMVVSNWATNGIIGQSIAKNRIDGTYAGKGSNKWNIANVKARAAGESSFEPS